MDIGNIILFVKDMKGVTAFYRDIVGLQPDEEQSFPAHRFFRFNTGQCKLCLHSASKPNGGRTKDWFSRRKCKSRSRCPQGERFKIKTIKK